MKIPDQDVFSAMLVFLFALFSFLFWVSDVWKAWRRRRDAKLLRQYRLKILISRMKPLEDEPEHEQARRQAGQRPRDL